MREAVKVIIVDKEIGFRIPQRFTVVLQTSREFINEPERIISYEEKMEYISQQIKNSFYEHLLKHKSK